MVSTPPLPSLPTALTLAEAALQRQGALLGATAAGPGALPLPVPGAAPGPVPLPLSPEADQLHLSPQAQSQLKAAAPAAPPTVTAALPAWPVAAVPAPQRALVDALLQQLVAPARAPQVLAAQPWPAALLPQVDGAQAAPGVPPLVTWLVRQGLVQTEQGLRSVVVTLRTPPAWAQAQPQPPAAGQPPLQARFAGLPQALTSGAWALVLQGAGPTPARSSALLVLEFAPLAPPLYGRELLAGAHRTDPWLLLAALQASGQLPRDEALAAEREARLCAQPGCPYAGRAPCEQPFCLALRTVLPVAPPPDVPQ